MFQLPTVPIWQAPTGSVAGPELAAAVAEAGGVGAMGLTWTSPEDASRKVLEVRQRTRGLFQANFALHFEPASLSAALEEGIPVVTFSWGIPKEEAALVRSFGAGLGIQVATAEGAAKALELNPDFLVCQGVEAGGHVQASRPLAQVLEEVLAVAGSIPVVAAGGIATAEDIVRVLKAGARGAMLGTRFVASKESLAHPRYKDRLVAADETALTVCFDGGWPGALHRVMRNTTLDNWEAEGCPLPGNRPGEEDVVATADGEPILRYDSTAPRKGMEGHVEAMCLYAGQSCAAIRNIPSARDLVQGLWAEVQKST